MQQFLSDIKNKKNIRESLRGLIDDIKADPSKSGQVLATLTKEEWCELLEEDDAKSRKNAATLLSLLPWDRDDAAFVAQKLFLRYEKEETLFVRESYVKALQAFDCRGFKDALQARFDRLATETFSEEDLKHIRKERQQLGQLLEKLQEQKGHQRKGLPRGRKWLFRSEPWMLDLLQQEYPQGKRLPFGLLVDGANPKDLVANRLYEQLLIQVPQAKDALIREDDFRTGFARCGLMALLEELFEGDKPFAFRLDIYGKYENDRRIALMKQAAADLEDASSGRLYNAPSDYEIELVLFPRRDGTFGLFLWPQDLGEERFSYRKNHSSVSMAPQKAAAAAQIAKPFLSSGVFRLDGFCGEGTLLLECERVAPSKEVFGCDIFGDAIRGGRENAEAAGVDLHFVQRDYFDFTNRVTFAELVTEFPDMFHKQQAEKDAFFKAFFQSSLKLTMTESVWVVITSEENLLKKYIRLNEQLSLKLQAPFGKEKALYVIRRQEDGLDEH